MKISENYTLVHHRLLSHIEAKDWPDVAWYNGEHSPDNPHAVSPVAYVDCSDTFGWGVSDAEDILPEDVEWVWRSYQLDNELGLIAWVCAKRDAMPFDKWMEKNDEGFPELVEAVKKLRDPVLDVLTAVGLHIVLKCAVCGGPGTHSPGSFVCNRIKIKRDARKLPKYDEEYLIEGIGKAIQTLEQGGQFENALEILRDLERGQ